MLTSKKITLFFITFFVSVYFNSYSQNSSDKYDAYKDYINEKVRDPDIIYYLLEYRKHQKNYEQNGIAIPENFPSVEELIDSLKTIKKSATLNNDDMRGGEALITFNNLSDSHVYAFWDFGDGNTYEGLESTIEHTYKASGYYLVTLIIEDQLGCKSTIEKIVHISSYPFYLPNAFTPENFSSNPNNNYFGLKTDKLNSFTMMIYDRWGTEIYRTSDLNKPWDGKYKNRILPVGVYTYHLRIITLENKVVSLSGTVSLMR